MQFPVASSKLAIAGLAVAGALAVQQPMQAASYTVDDFSGSKPGQSIEGLGTVHELLNIDAVYGKGVAIFEGQGYSAYGAYNADTKRHSDRNGGLQAGGFADKSKKNAFRFTFADDVMVSEFSLNMLDYGDWNPKKASWHSVALTAYDAMGNQLSQDLIEHTTKRNRPYLGQAAHKLEGDANFTTDETRLGSTLLSVSGNNIASVDLTFDNDGGRKGYSSDPNVGFDYVKFTTVDSENVSVPEPASAVALFAIAAVGTVATKRQKMG